VVRGDVLGILVAAYLRADVVAAPVSCNTAIEKSGLFPRVLRTRIGSPYVVAALRQALEDGARRAVGFEANGGFARGDSRIHLPPGAGLPPHGASRPLIAWSIGVGCGASYAIRRRTALELGSFDEALDMGSVLPGGGEQDMLWRVLAAGHHVVYEPRVRAQHDHRREWADAEHQILEHNRAMIATLTKAVVRAPARYKPSVVAFLVWRLLKPFVRLGKRAVGKDPLPASSLVRLCAATWRGLGAYPRAVRLAAARAQAVPPEATRGE